MLKATTRTLLAKSKYYRGKPKIVRDAVANVRKHYSRTHDHKKLRQIATKTP